MGVRNSFKESEVKKILKLLGCYFLRTGKGSHEVRYYPTTKKVFALAFHTNKPIREGTLRAILMTVGIEEKEFLKLAGKHS